MMEKMFLHMEKKRKSFTIEDKIHILDQVDAHVGKRIDLATRMGLSVSTLNSIVKQREKIEKCYSKCGPSFSKSRKSLKMSPMEELETTLASWFKQARTSNLAIDGSLLKEKALHIATRLGLEDFKASNGWLDRFKKRQNLIYKTVSGESASVDPATVSDWKQQISHLTEGYEFKDIFNADETGLFFNLQPNRTLAFKGDACHGGTKSKQRITVLLACYADGSEKLPPLVIGKFQNPRCFKNIKTLPTKYKANQQAWMTGIIFEEFLVQLDRQMGAKNRKIILFIDQCAAHPKETSGLRNIKIMFLPPNCTSQFQPLDLGIIHSFKCYYRKQLLRKAVAMIDGGMIEDVSKLKLNILQALHFVAEAWREISPETIKNCFKNCGFQVDSEMENIVLPVLTSYETQDWLSLKISDNDCDFEDYVTVDNELLTCEIQSVDQILDEESSAIDKEIAEEDEEDEEKVTFIQAITGLDTARKYFQQFSVDENVLISCSEIENKLYALKHLENKKQMSILDWVNK